MVHDEDSLQKLESLPLGFHRRCCGRISNGLNQRRDLLWIRRVDAATLDVAIPQTHSCDAKISLDLDGVEFPSRTGRFAGCGKRFVERLGGGGDL